MKSIFVSIVAAVLLVGCGGSIHEAAKDGNIEAVKQAIADGADVNARDGLYGTPLHEAAWKGHKEIAELLITKGADVNAKDDGGLAPLD